MTAPATLAVHGGTPAVPYRHPHADRAAFTAADRRAVADYLDRPGPTNSIFGRDGVLREFEDELADYFGRRHCILTNSGTNALHSAFFAAGIEPGDEVICPTYTFHATVTPLLQLGAVPVLADAELDTGNIDPAHVEKLITDRTRAVVVTHQWGHPVDGPALRAIAQSARLVLIEDVSLAVGASLDDELAGSFGDIACLSLGSTKLLSGGQGGALLLDDDAMWERATLLGHFSRRSLETVASLFNRQFADTGYGHNYRMHVLAIVVSRARFHRLDELIRMRHERYDLLADGLDMFGALASPTTRPGAFRGSWHGFCAAYDADATGIPLAGFAQALAAEGLEVAPGGYQPPLHLARLFCAASDGVWPRTGGPAGRRVYRPGDLPVAEAHVSRLLGFPLFLDEPMALVEAYVAGYEKVAAQLDRLRGSS